MMISRAQVNAVLKAYLERMETRKAGAAGPADTASSDRVRLSDDARRIAHWVRLAKALPDARADRVARVREALAQGTYNPDPRAVAEKILERLITDRAIEEQDG